MLSQYILNKWFRLQASLKNLATSKLNQVLEAKWREFQESNPYKDGVDMKEETDDEAVDEDETETVDITVLVA